MAASTLTKPRFSREERIGLAVAVLAHGALFGWLALEPLGKPVLAPPERMTVSLASEAAPDIDSLELDAQAAPELAPDLGELPLEPPELMPPADEPVEEPLEPPAPSAPPSAAPSPPPPRPVPIAKPAPKSKAQAKPVKEAEPPAKPTLKVNPAAKVEPAVKSKPTARMGRAAHEKSTGRAQPGVKPSAAAKPPGKAARADERARGRPDAPKGASRIDKDFLKGLPSADATGPAQAAPKAKAGPEVLASLSQAIARQLKPRWIAPQGADADQLVTVLAWELNRDGSLAGRPRVVRQTGVTDANRAQQARHAEQAIRAVRLAAPFRLPPQYYDSWRRVASFRFDRKLSQ